MKKLFVIIGLLLLIPTLKADPCRTETVFIATGDSNGQSQDKAVNDMNLSGCNAKLLEMKTEKIGENKYITIIRAKIEPKDGY